MPDGLAVGVSYGDNSPWHRREIATAVRSLLPEDVHCAAGLIANVRGQLFTSEELALEKASAVRRSEFLAGRTFARQALTSLGLPPAPLPRARDRRPIWPRGYIGSISHSRTACVCIAARRQSYIGLGVDIERSDPLKSHLYYLIGRSEERESFHIPVAYEDLLVDRGKLTFSIKEAVYKACCSVSRQSLSFQDVSVDIGHGVFAAKLTKTVPHLIDHKVVYGRWAICNGHTVATLAIPAGLSRIRPVPTSTYARKVAASKAFDNHPI